jgi:two-component system sensor histidine kinase UhpB
LFWRIYLMYAVVALAAAAALLVGPVTVSTPALLTEVVVLVIGLGILLVLNGSLFRIGLAPLRRLTRTMTTVDLLQPAPRPTDTGRGEIADLISAFNSMLDRLEAERSLSAARALSAQERERHRIAQELHDEVGQTLTAVLLELKRVADHATPPVRDELHQVQETTRGSLDEIRRIARRLRPGVLTELGLVSALRALGAEFATHTGLDVRCTLGPDLPDLDEETELVIYRVAQESLTNIARHAQASRVELTLCFDGDTVELRVADDGRGIGNATEGSGIQGMRERALLIGAKLTIAARTRNTGTEIRLQIPVAVEQS